MASLDREPTARARAAADGRSARRPRGDGARAHEPAGGRGPASPRRAAAEARRGGGVGVARPGRGVHARGRARRRHHGRDARAAHAPERTRRRAAHRRAGELLGRAGRAARDAGQQQLRRGRAHQEADAAQRRRRGAARMPDSHADRARPAPVRRADRRTRGPRAPRTRGAGAAREAGALLRGGDRQRHRLRARAPHRARAHARLRARVAAGGARLRDGPAVRAGCQRADRRRRVRRLARGPATRWPCSWATWPARASRPPALSAMVRFFVEARSWDTLSPAKVLEQANAMLLGRLPRDTFVTAFLGILSNESLRYCNAGHLPPLHVRSGSAVPARRPRPAAGRARAPRLLGERAAPGARATSSSRTPTA